MEIRAGTLDEVVIDHRFNGDASTPAVVTACRRRGARDVPTTVSVAPMGSVIDARSPWRPEKGGRS